VPISLARRVPVREAGGSRHFHGSTVDSTDSDALFRLGTGPPPEICQSTDGQTNSPRVCQDNPGSTLFARESSERK